MDNHPSCRRLHKIPAHTFKDQGSGLSAVPVCCEVSFVARAAIMPAFRFVNTFFKAVSPEWTLLPMLLRRWTRGPFVVASRLLCRTFESVNTFVRSTRSPVMALLIACRFRGSDALQQGRILEILQISSRLFHGDDRSAATSGMTYARRSLRRCRALRGQRQRLSMRMQGETAMNMQVRQAWWRDLSSAGRGRRLHHRAGRLRQFRSDRVPGRTGCRCRPGTDRLMDVGTGTGHGCHLHRACAIACRW